MTERFDALPGHGGLATMMQGRSRRVWLMCLAMLALAFTPVPPRSAAASCAAPYLVVGETPDRPIVARALELTVSGYAFVHGCDDTGAVSVNAFGCESSEQRERTTPMKNVRLLLQQGDKSWTVGTEDAVSEAGNKMGNVTWRVQIPTEVQAGRAMLVADTPPRGMDSLDATLRVTVSQP